MNAAVTSLLLAAAAAAWPLHSTGDIQFTVDGAAFSSGGGLTWQELYWSFPAGGFEPAETLGQRVSQFRTVITLADSGGALSLNESWITTAPLPAAAELKRKHLVRLDQIGARGLRPGAYRLRFAITDLVSGRSGELDAAVAVPEFRDGRPSVSQIQLASDIRADSGDTRFRKGGLRVMPNPGRLFGEGGGLYYYLELYGLSGLAGGRLRVSYKSDDDSVAGVILSEALAAGEPSAVRTGGFTIDDMPDGGYQLWVQLSDGRDRILAASAAPFTVKRNPLAAVAGAGRMLEEQAELQKQGGRYYDRIEHIATGRALETYRRLDSLGRREFLRQFWKARDPDPATPANEALREHARRCEYADAAFGEKMQKGMTGSQTDRGRIYIKFGEPEEIDNRPMQYDSKPVLIWRYPGSRKFIFIDVSGFGRFELAWTNATGERSAPNFAKMLSAALMDAEGIE